MWGVLLVAYAALVMSKYFAGIGRVSSTPSIVSLWVYTYMCRRIRGSLHARYSSSMRHDTDIVSSHK